MLGITNVSNAPSIVLKDTVVSTWTSGSYNGYSYRGTIPITGVTANTIAEVTFSQAQAESGNYSSVCTTYDGGLYVYSKVNTQITIPSIIIHSIVETYYEMDNSPVSGSTKAVTSGGVFDAIGNKDVSIALSSGITGVTVYNLNICKVGRVIQVKCLFNCSGTITDTRLFTITGNGTSVRSLLVDFPIQVDAYFTTNGHTQMWFERTNDKYTSYLRVPSDISFGGNNWVFSFCYITDE